MRFDWQTPAAMDSFVPFVIVSNEVYRLMMGFKSGDSRCSSFSSFKSEDAKACFVVSAMTLNCFVISSIEATDAATAWWSM